jgi:hypothetical protein
MLTQIFTYILNKYFIFIIIMITTTTAMSCASSVSKVTCYELDDQGSIPGRFRYFIHHHVNTVSEGAIQPAI